MAVCGGLIGEMRNELLALTDEFAALAVALGGLIQQDGPGDFARKISAGLRESVESLGRQADTLNSAAEVYAAAEGRLLEMAMALPTGGTPLPPVSPGYVDAPTVFGGFGGFGETPKRSAATDTGLILEDWFSQLAYGEV
jgi:hypothetical protein